MTTVLFRLVAELACLTGVICAAALAYHGESGWVWSWFLLFAFANIITGSQKKDGK